MKAYDVVIVGGGIVGSSAAYFLRKQGFKGTIALIERDTSYANGCTARSCGGIRQQFSTPENIRLSKFGLNILRHLKEEFGPEADVSFREQGYLILASESGRAILEENHAIQVANGADNVLLDADGLAKQFPWLVTDGLALGCFGRSGEGWLDPYSLMSLFRKAAAARGVDIIQGEVASVKKTDGRASSLTLTDGTEIACGTLVNAGGTGAGALARMAGIELPVGPRKRYVYVLDCPGASEALHRAPLTVDISGIYFRPEGQQFISGLSPEEVDEPADMDWEVDYNWFEERIWETLAARVPAFEAIKVVNAWVGHYDYNALDQNAVIGPHPDLTNLYFANGFSGHGAQQGAPAGRAIAELIVHGRFVTLDLTRLGYARIAAKAPLTERNVI
jgi:FAD-dependent oxidoreductase domain-containing protein 1